MSAEGEDLFDDFLNSRLEDDGEHATIIKLNDDSLHTELNDEEFEKLLNESETEPHHQKALSESTPQKASGINGSTLTESVESSSSISASTQQQQISTDQNNTQEDDDDGVVIEFQWTDEDQIKDETDQAKQNELISKISKFVKRKRSTTSEVEIPTTESSSTTTTTTTTTKTSDSNGDGGHQQEIVETRISLMISDILNRFGKVMDIDSRGEVIETRMSDLRKEDPDSLYSFAKLKESLQRKLVVLECTIGNLCTLIEKNVQRKGQLREAKKILKDQLIKATEVCSEKSNQLEEAKEKYKRMEAVYQKDRNQLLQIIETLKLQIKDPENEVVKNLKIPEAPTVTSLNQEDDSTLSTLTKSLLTSLPDSWKNVTSTPTKPQPSTLQTSPRNKSNRTSSSSSSSATTSDSTTDPLAAASSWFSSWMK
nr:unnamed protein product [Naegleria fowleri]